MPSVVAMASASSSQISWTSPRPSVEPPTSSVTRSCGSRCISSSEMPPSSPTTGSSTWSDRRPARTWARCASGERDEVDREARGRRTRREPPGRAPGTERDAADDQRDGDERQQARLGPPRPRTDAAAGSRGSVGPARRAGRRAPSRATRPPRLARGAGGPGRSTPRRRTRAARPVDRPAVDERAVRAPEVLDVPAPAAVREHGVIGRGERVLDDDRVVDVPAERRDGVEVEGAAGLRLAGRATRRRPAGPSAAPGSRAAARRSRSSDRTTRARNMYSRARNRSRTTQTTSRNGRPSGRRPRRPRPRAPCRRARSGRPHRGPARRPARRSRANRWCCRGRRRRACRAGRRSGRGGATPGCRAGRGRCRQPRPMVRPDPSNSHTFSAPSRR